MSKCCFETVSYIGYQVHALKIDFTHWMSIFADVSHIGCQVCFPKPFSHIRCQVVLFFSGVGCKRGP